MKYILSVLLIIPLSLSVALGQNQRPEVDVLHLENGGVRKGTIIERKPGESLKIETVNGQVFVYKLSEIKKIVRGTSTSGGGQKQGGDQQDEQKVSKKSPAAAAALSLLFVGGGQYYNGQAGKGAILTGLAVTGGVLIGTADFNDDDQIQAGYGLILGSSLYSIIDAPIVASNINDRVENQQRTSYGHLIELRGDGYTLGVDAFPSRDGGGMRLAVHF